MGNKPEKNIVEILKKKVGSALSDAEADSVLLGLSGGADSVALLRILLSLNVRTICVHCNFHLRGEESERDFRFVEKLCESLGVELIILHFDTIEYCRKEGLSIEMGCRKLRYDAFRGIKRQRDLRRIVVAHHLDDNIETMLLNLFRGSGSSGIRGMKADTGEILRPLLTTPREQILEYLTYIGQDYIVDSSNNDTRFRRNLIRCRLLPMIEEEWPGIRKSLSAAIDHAAEEEKIIDTLMRRILDKSSDTLLWTDAMESGSPSTVVFRFINRFGGSPTIAAEICRHFLSPDHVAGKSWKLENVDLVSGGNSLSVVERISDDEPLAGTTPKGYIYKEIANTPENLAIVCRRGAPAAIALPFPIDRYLFRHPAEGDIIRPFGMKGKMKVSEVMKDARLSPVEKKRQWVLADRDSGEIIWVAGLKRSRLHAIDPSTDTLHIIRPTDY